MTLSHEDLERAFDWLQTALARDPGLAREFGESRQAYFGHRRSGLAALDRMALRRHLEWFLLERFSPVCGGVPIEVLVHAARAGNLEADEGEGTREQALAATLNSLASVFEVTGVLPGEGVWVRDLAGGGEYALEEPEASQALEPEDLLVGRLFDVGGTLHRMSSAAGVFREQRLRAAVARDLERARASRRGSLRLSQAELEKMFWGEPSADGKPGDAVERARGFLLGSGVAAELADAILRELVATPFDAHSILSGGEDALGRALDRLAFESGVDLDLARQALLEAWSAQAAAMRAPVWARRATGPGEGGEVDVQAAVSAFDRGRREGRDLEQLFRELEQDLGLEDEEEEEACEEAPVPDFPGAVGAVVEEYLWDLERQGLQERAREHACLRKLGEFGTSVGVFENLSARDLLVFCTVWLPELGQLQGAADARAMLGALESFCAWCEEQQDLPLAKDFTACAAALSSSLPRASEANRLRERGADLEEGQVFEVVEIRAERLGLSDAKGGRHEARAERDLTALLRPGDRLRAAIDGRGKLRLFCCYPPESARIPPR